MKSFSVGFGRRLSSLREKKNDELIRGGRAVNISFTSPDALRSIFLGGEDGFDSSRLLNLSQTALCCVEQGGFVSEDKKVFEA